MAEGRSPLLAVILVVLGAIILLGKLSIGFLLPYAGIALIVVGVLILLKAIPGTLLVGVVVLVLGILLQGHWLALPKGTGALLGTIDLVVGIVLVVLGVLKLAGR